MRFPAKDILSLFTAVKYAHGKDSPCDYSSSPRPCHNITFFLEGEAEMESDGKSFTVHKGEILFIPQGTTYRSVWKAKPKAVFHTLHFNFAPQVDPLLEKRIPVQAVRVDDFGTLYDRLLEIERYQYEKDENFFLALSAFFYLLNAVFKRAEAVHVVQTENPVLPAINYLREHYKEKITVDELAALCFLSPSRFYSVFKQKTGLSPVSYKNELLIQNVKQALLTEKKSVEEISEDFGFESSIYLRRLFKKSTGKTPTQYKKEESLL